MLLCSLLLPPFLFSSLPDPLFIPLSPFIPPSFLHLSPLSPSLPILSFSPLLPPLSYPFFLLTTEELPPGITGPISPRGPDSVLHSPHPSPRLPLHPHHTLCCHSPPGSRPHDPAETIQPTQHLRSERGSSIASIQEDKNIFLNCGALDILRSILYRIVPWAKKHVVYYTVLSVC